MNMVEVAQLLYIQIACISYCGWESWSMIITDLNLSVESLLFIKTSIIWWVERNVLWKADDRGNKMINYAYFLHYTWKLILHEKNCKFWMTGRFYISLNAILNLGGGMRWGGTPTEHLKYTHTQEDLAFYPY